MNSNIKPLITLSNINSLPDGHVHSKISFLKSIINEEQNPEIRLMKERMYKLTYTVKNIGVHGEQIGITSKRVPLKEKQDFVPSEVTSQKRKQIFVKKYLPQNSFFSQPLVAIKKQKTQQEQNFQTHKKSFLLDVSRLNQNEYSQTHHIHSQSKFSKKAFNKSSKFGKTFLHSSKFNNVKTDRNDEKEDRFIEDFQKMKRAFSQQQLPQKRFQNKKSFAKLLNECGNMKKQEIIVPIQHQQNPLFKKIKKLKEISSIKTIDKYENYRSNRAITQIPSQIKSRHQLNGSIIEREIHRRTLSKNI